MEQENKRIKDILRHGSRPAAAKLIRAHYDEIYVFVYRLMGLLRKEFDCYPGYTPVNLCGTRRHSSVSPAKRRTGGSAIFWNWWALRT